MKLKQKVYRFLAGVVATVMMISTIPMQKIDASSLKVIKENETITVALAEEETSIYKFTAPKDGYFWVELTVMEGSYSNTYVFVTDQSDDSVMSGIEACSLGSKWETEKLATKAGEIYNIYVSMYSAYATSKSEVRVKFVASDEWENEPNNTKETACGLKNNMYKYGATTYADCGDYFKFQLKKTSKVTFTFGSNDNTKYNNRESIWDVYLIDSNYEMVRLFRSVGSELSKTVYLKKGTYYLEVNEVDNTLGVAYKIKYKASEYTVKTPKIKTVTIKKNKSNGKRYLDRITMDNTGDIAGYTVQVAKKKSMSGKYINKNVYKYEKNNNVTSTTIRFYDATKAKNLKTKKATYYVRVRSFVQDAFGNNIYGKYSTVKKITK